MVNWSTSTLRCVYGWRSNVRCVVGYHAHCVWDAYFNPNVHDAASTLHPMNLLQIGIGYQVYQQDPITFQRTPIATIPFRRPLAPAWVHDFATTDRYLVVVQCPLYFNLLSILTGQDTEHCFMDWCPQDGVRMDVVDLESGRMVASHTTDYAFWAFHYVNLQYDAARDVLLLDASVYRDPEIVNQLYLDRVRAHPGQDHAVSALRRFELPLGRGLGAAGVGKQQQKQVGASGGGAASLDGIGMPLVGKAAQCSYFDFPVIHPG